MSLRYLLDTGMLPGLVLGSTEGDVKSQFGNPSDVALRKGRPHILRYGGLQVFLGRGALKGFAIYFNEDALNLPLRLTLDVPVRPRMPKAEALACLAAAGVSCVPLPQLTFDEQAAYETPAHLHVMFNSGALESIQRHEAAG